MSEESTIQERADTLVGEFEMFDDWLGRYEYLIEIGDSLPPLDDRYHTEEYRVRGCQSQVWLVPEYRDGRIYFSADSDAMITKGLVALLIRVIEGQPPEAIANAPMDFLNDIGMQEHLSSTRKNGLASMVGRIRQYAAQLVPHD